MSIKSIKILNVLAFQRHWRENGDLLTGSEDTGISELHDAFKLEFGDGINVLIGENGVGKTTILKMIYAAAQQSVEQNGKGKQKLLQYFSNSLQDSDALKNAEKQNGFSYYEVSDGIHFFKDSLSHDGILDYAQWTGLNIPAVFIPTTEMLSHSKGFLALNQKYRMPFDQTQIDIIVDASLPETREIPAEMKLLLDRISDTIDGTVVMEDDYFYVLKKDGRKVEFSLEAEGFRKLGLIWKLIRNGLLGRGTVLLWDEPEANLNPELYSLAAEILLGLQKNGVQIFVATHSYNFAKYLELRRKDEKQVLFHNIFKDRPKKDSFPEEIRPLIDDEKEMICSQSAYKMDKLKKNHIMIADNKLLDEIFDL